jgi:biopolymer transport protein ExbD
MAQRVSGLQPLRMRVCADGRSPHPILSMGSKIVPWEDFGAVLQEELNRRPPDWPVYVDGDRTIEWRSVTEAIDAIQGQGAQVVLLTSGN